VASVTETLLSLRTISTSDIVRNLLGFAQCIWFVACSAIVLKRSIYGCSLMKDCHIFLRLNRVRLRQQGNRFGPRDQCDLIEA